MENSKKSPESVRIEESREHSAPTFDQLNLDSLLAIFQYLPLLDVLRLRYQCRSVNDAVCQFLRTSCRKLALHLDVERSGKDLDRAIAMYNSLDPFHGYHDRNIPRRRPGMSLLQIHNSHLFQNQPHFRSEDVTPVKSLVGSTDRKIGSLIDFLTTYLPNLRELALLIAHEDYFRSVARLLSPLRKLKVFFIDVTLTVPDSYGLNYPDTETVDAISGLPELDALYYFRDFKSSGPLRRENSETIENSGHLREINEHRLSSGGNFLEVILPRLRVLHCHYYTFPVGMTLDKIEEISMNDSIKYCLIRNHFPTLKTLIYSPDSMYSPGLFGSPFSECRLSFGNVKVLKIVDWSLKEYNWFIIHSKTIRALNDLSNLEELHCDSVNDRDHEVIERNNTIVRLFSKCHPNSPDLKVCRIYQVPDTKIDITPEKMTEYANMCKKYFRRLQLVTTEHPPRVHQF